MIVLHVSGFNFCHLLYIMMIFFILLTWVFEMHSLRKENIAIDIRILVTSDTVGCIPIVPSKSFLVAPNLIATA